MLFISNMAALCTKRGRPTKFIDEEQVLSLKGIGMKWCQIAELIGVSERTLRERRKYFQHQISSFTSIDHENLDGLIREILNSSPNSGERMVLGGLLAKNVKVQRSRVRDSLQRIDFILIFSPSCHLSFLMRLLRSPSLVIN